MSLIFRSEKISKPGVYTFTVPSGVGDIEIHLWGAGGGDGSQGTSTTVVLDPGTAGTPGTPDINTPAGSQSFSSSGQFTVPPGVTSISVSVLGGGGGGGGGHVNCSNSSHSGGAGGGGASASGSHLVTPGQRISFTVGAGGAGGAGGSSGGSGGTSSILGTSAAGGGGGAPGTGNGRGASGNNLGGGNGGTGGAWKGGAGTAGGSGRVTISWGAAFIPGTPGVAARPTVTETIQGARGGRGAGGGYSFSKVRVYPGDVITVAVGARGTNGGSGGASLTTPRNYSGGSGGAGSKSDGGGGGGASVVLVNNVVVAVAGGGGGGGAGGRPGYSLTPTSTTSTNSDAKQYEQPGIYTYQIPEGVTSVNVDITGAGGGGGGNDAGRNGADGSAGGRVSGTVAVAPGDYLTIGVGQGGRPASSDARGTGGGAGGESLNGLYVGGRGGNAGGAGTSGGGGGGGGATVILRNGVPVAVAHGGGGGGGAGIGTPGQPAVQITTGNTVGGAGQDKSGDGGGGGGGGGGASGGAGGITALLGDQGARTGSDGTDLVPTGGASTTGAAGGVGAISGTRSASVGQNGRAQISWSSTTTVPGTSIISVNPAGNSIGGDGTPATNLGSGYGVQGLGQSSGAGSSSGGGGGGGFYGGVSGVSGEIGGGGQGGTNYGNIVYSGIGQSAGGRTVSTYPGGSAGDGRFDGAAVINFIKSFTFNVKESGRWRLVNQGYVKIAGLWKTIYNGYVKINGTWYLINNSEAAETPVPQPVGVYQVAGNVGTINEGAAVRFTLTTTNVPAGTVVPYFAFGLTSGDLDVGQLNGSFVVGTTDSIVFVPKADRTTSGNRSLTVELQGKNLRSTVTILDSSRSPQAFLSANVPALNEGEAVRFTITTQNIDAGTVVPYTISGISQSDLSSGSISGQFVVGSAMTADLALANDFTSGEGNETITMRITSPVSNSVSVNVTDSSVLPAGVVEFTSGSGNWTVPANVTRVRVTLIGGGGGGASGHEINPNTQGGGGGGSGGFRKDSISVTPGQVLSYAVGTGGAGIATGKYDGGRDGSDGTSTTFGSLTATGGGKGISRPTAGGAAGSPGGVAGSAGESRSGDTSSAGGAGAGIPGISAGGAGGAAGSNAGQAGVGYGAGGGGGGGRGGDGVPTQGGGAAGNGGYIKVEWGPSVGQ